VQWLLCFELAIAVQALQQQQQQQQQQQRRRRRRQQRQQQKQQDIQPAEQLLLALGLPAEFSCSSYKGAVKDDDGLVALVTALFNQLQAAHEKTTFQAVPTTCRAPQPIRTSADMVPGAVPTSDHRHHQQQQQQQSGAVFPEADAVCGVFVTMPPQLVQPLVLTLLQLCQQEQASLLLLERSLRALHELLSGCRTTTSIMSEAALSNKGHLELMTAEMKAAAAEACSSCEAVIGDLTEVLLCRLGPAVLRAVRKLEKPPSCGKPGSSSSSGGSGLQPGTGREEDAAQLAEAAMSTFGSLVIQYLTFGKLRVTFLQALVCTQLHAHCLHAVMQLHAHRLAAGSCS
jgi:hypothetical protein